MTPRTPPLASIHDSTTDRTTDSCTVGAGFLGTSEKKDLAGLFASLLQPCVQPQIAKFVTLNEITKRISSRKLYQLEVICKEEN